MKIVVTLHEAAINLSILFIKKKVIVPTNLPALTLIS